MPSANDLTMDTSEMSVLIFGDIGSGKTHFANTAPKPAFLFNLEGTEISYRGTDTDYENFTIDGDGWKKMLEVTHQLLEGTYTPEGADAPRKYKTIIVDNASIMAKLAYLNVFKHNKDGKPLYDSSKTMPMWGQVAEQYLAVLNMLRQIPAHLVCTAHLKTTVNEMGMKVIEPDLTGQLKNAVRKYFSEIYYAFASSEGKGNKASTKFTLQTKPDKTYPARSRLDKEGTILPRIIEDNTWEAVMSYFEKEGVE